MRFDRVTARGRGIARASSMTQTGPMDQLLEPMAIRRRPRAMERRIPLLLATVALVTLANLAAPVGRVLACSCGGLGADQALANADAAFIGVVTQVAVPEAGPIISTADPIFYTFVVETALKGPLEEDGQVVVSSTRDGASCGQAFAISERWRIFAYSDKGQLATTICSGNELLAEHVSLPVLPTTLDDGLSLPPPEVLFGIGAILVLVAVSAIAFRRGGARR